MSETMEYKCPACGGALAFDSASQKLKCPYCGSEFEINHFEKRQEEAAQKEDSGKSQSSGGEMNWDEMPGGQWDAGEEEGMNVYICNSCGGELVCDETTTSASCPYCGSPVVLKGRLSGMLKPDFIIPFKLDKKAAKDALRRYAAGKKLVPKLFRSENHIDEIKGMYVPFWLFDAAVTADMTYHGERIRSWSDSEYNYVEHNHYNIHRAGNVIFDHVPVDGSEKMPDDMMESIEPYDFREAVDFKKAYLAGFMADKYDVDAQTSIEAANRRIRRSTEEAFRETVHGFGVITTGSSYVNLQQGRAKYALYPVWMLSTRWQGKTYTFAMNGQTGKFVGDLPMDKGAYRRKLFILAGIFSAVGSIAAAMLDYLFI